jgi:energy-coupling factor transporter ATP-binding protein EcfA2
MRLLRVQVPEFRVLKDVDISFEPDFTPQVFPLGSLNGGGKSTLLQLIFVLLQHFSNPNQTIYLQNIISEIKTNNPYKGGLKNLANIKLMINNIEIVLEYSYLVVNPHDTPVSYQTGKENKICFFMEKIGFNYNTVGVINFEEKFFLENVLNIQNIIKTAQQEVSRCIFLICPANQPYLFLSREQRRSLFTENKQYDYDRALESLQQTLPNFFTFDFVDVLVEVFRRARAKDFKERNKENPFFHTEKLEADINSLFIDGKKINSLIIEQQRHTQDEIQGVFFTLPSGEEIYPEDLSHGELKRLAIFVLIKYHEMNDSIVLMDEIENGFHPDWQRHIVDDLVEWGASNQYILATHSYELCRGVTPAHVKDLDPKLSY